MALDDLLTDLTACQAAITKAEAAQSYGTGQYRMQRADISALYAERARLRKAIAQLGGDPDNPAYLVSYGVFTR